MDQTPHSKIPSSAERGNWLGSGVKDEKLAFADLIDERYGLVQPHAGWRGSIPQASSEDTVWHANAKQVLFSLSRGRDGLEGEQGSGLNDAGKQNIRQVYFHPHLPADPSPSGNPQPEWLIRRTHPESFVRADQSPGPSIIRTDFPKATVLHAEISQERLEFLLSIESKVLRLEEENSQLREDLKWRSKGHSQMETDLLGVMAEWRGKVGAVEATLESVTRAQQLEIEELRGKIGTMYPAEVVEGLRKDLAKLLGDMATSDDLSARDACIQELGAHLRVAHDTNQQLQAELDALQLRYQKLQSSNHEEIEQMKLRMETFRESQNIVQNCKSCMTELPELYAQINLLREEAASFKRSYHKAIEREAQMIRENEHRVSLMKVEVREALTTLDAMQGDLKTAANDKNASEKQIVQLTAILNETRNRMQTQSQEPVNTAIGIAHRAAAEFSANDAALAPGARRSTSTFSTFTRSMSDFPGQHPNSDLFQREKTVLAEQLRAAQRKAATLQLELDNAKRSLTAVNEREALRRQELDGELSKMNARLRGKIDENASLKSELERASTSAVDAEETVKVYKQQLQKTSEQASMFHEHFERMKEEHAISMQELHEKLLVATSKVNVSSEAIALLEADRDMKERFVKQVLETEEAKDDSLAGFVASNIHAGKMASLADQRSTELRRAMVEQETWKLRSKQSDFERTQSATEFKVTKRELHEMKAELEQTVHDKCKAEDKVQRLQLELSAERAACTGAKQDSEQAKHQAAELRSKMLQMFLDADSSQEKNRQQELKIVELYQELLAAQSRAEALNASQHGQRAEVEILVVQQELAHERQQHQQTFGALESERGRSNLLQTELESARPELQRLRSELDHLRQEKVEFLEGAERSIGAMEAWSRPASIISSRDSLVSDSHGIAHYKSLNAALEENLEAVCTVCLGYIVSLDGILSTVLSRAIANDQGLARARDQVQEQARELRGLTADLQRTEGGSEQAQAMLERLQTELALVRKQLEAEQQASRLAHEDAKRTRAELDSLQQRLRAAQADADFLRLKSHSGLTEEERHAANQLTRSLLAEVQVCAHQVSDQVVTVRGDQRAFQDLEREAQEERLNLRRAKQELEEARGVARDAEDRERSTRDAWEQDVKQKRDKIAALDDQLMTERQIVRTAAHGAEDIVRQVSTTLQTLHDTIGDEQRGEDDLRAALRTARERAAEAGEWRERNQPRLDQLEQDVRRERAEKDETEKSVGKLKTELEELRGRLRRELEEAEERLRKAEAGRRMAEGESEELREKGRAAEAVRERLEQETKATTERLEQEAKVLRERLEQEAKATKEKLKTEAEESEGRLRRELEEAEERLRKAEAGRRTAEGESEELREKGRAAEAVRERLEQETKATTERLEQEAKVLRERLEHETKEAREEIHCLKTKLLEAEAQMVRQRQQTKETSELLIRELSVDGVLRSLVQGEEALLQEFARLFAEKEEKDGQVALLSAEKEGKDGKIASLTAQISELEAGTAQLTNLLNLSTERDTDNTIKIQELQQELEMLQEGRGHDKQRLTAGLEAMMREHTSLQDRYENLELEFASLGERERGAKQLLQQSKLGFERSMQELQDLIHQTNLVVDVLKHAQSSAAQQNRALEQHRRDLGMQEEAKRAMSDRLKRLQTDEQEYLDSIGTLKFQLGESTRLAGNNKLELDRLQAQHKDAEARADKYQQESAAFQQNVSVFAGENATMKVKMQELETMCQRLRDELAAKLAENAALAAAVKPRVDPDRLEELVSDLEARLKNERGRREELEVSLARATDKASWEEERVAALEKDVTRDKAARVAAEANWESTKRELDDKTREIERLQRTLDALELEGSGRREVMEEMEGRLRRELEEAEERLRKAEAGRRTAEGESEELREKGRAAEAVRERLEQETKATTERLEQEAKVLRERLEHETKEAREEIHCLKTKLLEAEAQMLSAGLRVREVEAELVIATKDGDQLKETTKELEGVIETLRGEAKELSSSIEKVEKERAEELGRTVALASSCHASDGMIRTLTDELSRLGMLVQDLKQQLREERNRGEEIQVALARAAEKVLAAEEWREANQPRIASLEKESAAEKAAREDAERSLAALKRELENMTMEKEQLHQLTLSLEQEGSGRREFTLEMQARISGLEGEKRAAEAESADLRSKLSTLESKTQRLQSEVEGWKDEVERLRRLLAEAEAEMACTALRIREVEAELSLAVREMEMMRERQQELDDRNRSLLADREVLLARLAEYEDVVSCFEENCIRLALTVEGLEKNFAGRLASERAQTLALELRLIKDQDMMSAADCAGQELETTLRSLQQDHTTMMQQVMKYRQRNEELENGVAHLHACVVLARDVIGARKCRQLEQMAGIRALLFWRTASRLGAMRKSALNNSSQNLLLKYASGWKTFHSVQRGAAQMENGRPWKVATRCFRDWVLFWRTEREVAARAAEQTHLVVQKLTEEHQAEIKEYTDTVAEQGAAMEEMRRTMQAKMKQLEQDAKEEKRVMQARHAEQTKALTARQYTIASTLRAEIAQLSSMLFEIRREMAALMLGYEDAVLKEKSGWAHNSRELESQLAMKQKELNDMTKANKELGHQNEILNGSQSNLRSQARSLQLRWDQMEAARKAQGSVCDDENERLKKLLTESDAAALALEDALKLKTERCAVLQRTIDQLRQQMDDEMSGDRRVTYGLDAANAQALRLVQDLINLESRLRNRFSRAEEELLRKQRRLAIDWDSHQQLKMHLKIALEAVRIMHDVFCGNPDVSAEDIGVQSPTRRQILESSVITCKGDEADWDNDFSAVTRQVEEALRVSKVFQKDIREMRSSLAASDEELRGTKLQLALLQGRLESIQDAPGEVHTLQTELHRCKIQLSAQEERLAALQRTADELPELRLELKSERVKVTTVVQREAEQQTTITELRAEGDVLRQQVSALTKQLEVAVTELESEALATNRFTRCFLDISNRIEHSGSP